MMIRNHKLELGVRGIIKISNLGVIEVNTSDINTHQFGYLFLIVLGMKSIKHCLVTPINERKTYERQDIFLQANN